MKKTLTNIILQNTGDYHSCCLLGPGSATFTDMQKYFPTHGVSPILLYLILSPLGARREIPLQNQQRVFYQVL